MQKKETFTSSIYPVSISGCVCTLFNNVSWSCCHWLAENYHTTEKAFSGATSNSGSSTSAETTAGGSWLEHHGPEELVRVRARHICGSDSFASSEHSIVYIVSGFTARCPKLVKVALIAVTISVTPIPQMGENVITQQSTNQIHLADILQCSQIFMHATSPDPLPVWGSGTETAFSPAAHTFCTQLAGPKIVLRSTCNFYHLAH